MESAESNERRNKRILSYIGTFVVLFLGFILLRGSGWRGSTHLHTLMESVATLLAFVVGLIALLRFYTKKSNTILFIGIGFLGTALLDGYHAVVTSTSFSQFWPSPPPSLIPWSWNASRIFLSVLMLLSFLMWKREERLGERGRIQEKTIFLIVGVLASSCFLLFAFYPLPRAYYPGGVFGRPEEMISAFIFLAALIGYLRKGWWEYNQFEHWVILSLIVGFMGQAMFMSFSFQLFDSMFDMAHLLKKVSYICVMVGLLVSLYHLMEEAEEGRRKVEDVNEALQREIIERQHTEVALRRRDAILEAVSYAARSFIKVSSWKEPIGDVLKRLGKAAEVSRVYVFENHVGEDGELLTSQKFEWSAPGITPQIDNPELQNINWLEVGFGRWVDKMGQGEMIHGHVREFPGSERDLLSAQDIKSIIAVPIIVDQQWWGFIGFDECLVERPWLAVELDALRAAAGILGVAIQRQCGEERIDALNHMKEDLVGPGGLDVKLKRITDTMVEIFKSDYAGIWLTMPGDRCDKGCVHAADTKEQYICRQRDQCLHLMSSSGRYTHIDGEIHRRIPFGCCKIGRLAAGEESKFVTNDVTHDPRINNHNWAKACGLVSFAGYRLISQSGETIGVLALFCQHEISPDEDALLEDVANTTAQVVMMIKAEEALQEMASFAKLNPAPVLRIDSAGGIKQANPAAFEIFGVDEFEGRSIADILPVFEALDLCENIREGKIDTVETSIGERDFQFVINGVTDLDIAHVYGSDITERKRIVEKLKESEARYRTMFEAAGEGIVVAEIETKQLKYANPALCEMLGYSREELIRKNVTDIHPEEDLDHVVSEFEAQARGEKRLAPAIPCLRSDGEVFYADISVARVNVDGRDCLVGFFTDVTERKRMEQMKDDFVSAVSHEIRTPLTSIHGALDLISRGMAGKLSGKAGDLIRIARRNSERLRALINDILDIQKIESGRAVFDLQPLDLAPVIEFSVENNKSFGRQFNVEFVLDDFLPEVKVKADSDRLAQVMDNLLSNAAKFSPPDGEVEISISRHDDRVRVSVRDHGPGIKREFRKHVFQKFTQEDCSVTREKGGTGLGLSIAKLIVDKHGGEIGFETEIGKGTTFYFDLPEWKG